MARRIRGKNEGSIFQRRNGTWRAQISLDGKRISFGATSKAECQVWLRNMQVQLDQGLDYYGGQIYLREYLQEWLGTCATTLRKNTIRQYKQIVGNYLSPNIGDISLRDLRLAKVERFYAELVQLGVGVRTIRIAHSVLHRSLEKAVRYGLILSNPAHGAALPRYRPPEMLVLDESQVSQFLVAAHGSNYEALYYLAITTGMRQGELFGLKWSDLKWTSGTLHVQRQVQRVVGQGWEFVEPKTRSGRRTIMLGEGTLQALRVHKEAQEVQKALVGERWQENDLIFTSTVGTPGDRSNLRLDFRKILEKAGVPIIRFHDLRHTAASILLNHGVPVIVVSKMLGHSKPSITMDIYGHLYHESQAEAARIMDELVTPILVELPEKINQNSEHDSGEK